MTQPDPADLRGVDRADVYLDDEQVATLSRSADDSVTFAYTAPAPSGAAVRAASVSWSLPADDTTPVVTAGAAVPAFFAGLLPEGVRLGVVVSSTKTSVDDHLTLLLAVGGDTVGNVRVVPSGTTPPIPLPMLDSDTPVDFRQVFERLAGSVDADPVALAGVQPKVSAAMWSTPTRTATGPAILKLTPPSGFPQLTQNEHFFMRMAADCGLRVPTTQLLSDSTGRQALLVERFDRISGRRIAQEDACQVNGLYPASKFRLKAETAIETLANACVRGGGSGAAATLELMQTVAFSWLIGNGDLHAKNLSIYAPDGDWRPTPAYDLLCTQPYAGWQDPMAMNLYGRANRLRRNDFVEAGTRLGLRERATRSMLDRLIDASGPWTGRCDEIGFPDLETDRLTTLLRERRGSLG